MNTDENANPNLYMTKDNIHNVIANRQQFINLRQH